MRKKLLLITIVNLCSASALFSDEFKKSEPTIIAGENEMSQENLVLYMNPRCPYCKKVFRALEDLNIVVKMVDITEDSAQKNRLISIGGKKQVPCLVIDSRPMYESDAIIDWLKNR